MPPRPLDRVLLRQYWRDLVFLHWEADPFEVSRLLPAGVFPDLLNGRTYVGLVFFRMEDLAFGPTRPVPYLGSFNEVNVRLYSRDGRGRRGVVFRSLDCDRLLPVLAARGGLGLPYRWSRISRHWFDRRLLYRVDGRAGADTGGRAWLEVEDTVVRPDPLEQFLSNRWGLHARVRGRSYYMPAHHPAWSFRRCRLLDWDASLVTAAGLTAPDGEPLRLMYAPGLPVRFGPPQRLGPHGD
ncbi:YqjF family protein [Streptomyces sp. NPDC001595]|uniref:YqjF family protein n=1 Tax=Streptomyces sp. NPDC001532 TaxID=3154520 RepID=UPI003328D7B1